MILAIDCGNTRIKWGVHEGGAWQATGAVPLPEVSSLATPWRALGAVDTIVIAHVAGDAVRKALAATLERFAATPFWVTGACEAAGVTNRYDDPVQLGADRWAALVGARRLVREACLVVNAGTATTVDLLSGEGEFLGGAILPGMALMKRSLANGTAGLPETRGEVRAEPRNTADAIETGCRLAQAGAIERMHARLPAGAACVLSGGDASELAAHLRIPHRVVEHLVLEGLVQLAGSTRP